MSTLLPRPGWVWYFAYGSNMNPARLFEARLKPAGVTWGRRIAGHVAGWQLVFDKPWYKFDGAGAANIRPQDGALTHGTLNEMPLAGLDVLDHYEGVADGHYRRTTMMVTTNFSVSVEAVAYLGIGDLADGLQPPCVYLAHLLAGADLLPEAYVADLRFVPCLAHIEER
jgi:cation transport regulator ChaC